MTDQTPFTRSATTPTVLWNDSADPDELAASIGFGAVGATCNPVIAYSVISKNKVLPDVCSVIEFAAIQFAGLMAVCENAAAAKTRTAKNAKRTLMASPFLAPETPGLN